MLLKAGYVWYIICEIYPGNILEHRVIMCNLTALLCHTCIHIRIYISFTRFIGECYYNIRFRNSLQKSFEIMLM